MTFVGEIGAGNGGALGELAKDGEIERAFNGVGGGRKGCYSEKKEQKMGRKGH